MSDNRDEKLESMLRSRRAQAQSPELAERIMLKARGIPQRQNTSLWQLLRDLCAEFHLPKPAYVLAGALALGVAVGFNTPPDSPGAQDVNAASTQGFLSADEDLL
ncbi:MAG TPA: hypothetical protein VIH18_23445 [Candidatus Binatia bacterium]|jgi:hypothetical protein